VAGDLSRVVLFALRNVERKDVKITQTRKPDLPLSKPQLLHVGAEARSVIRAWAEEEGVSVNAIMVSVLEQFFKRLRKSKALREEFRLELRATARLLADLKIIRQNSIRFAIRRILTGYQLTMT
jgi:hypothetical protein